jgi:RNA polymerase sigma-70 factor (ECF subfamily)
LRRRDPADEATRAFEEILEHCEKRVFNLVKRLVGDREEACDLTQETFIRAFKSMETFRRDSNPYTWLSKIALNLCRNRFRQRQRRTGRERTGFQEEIGAGISGETDGWSAQPRPGSANGSPHHAVEANELNQKINQALTQLSYEHRVAIVLRDFEGCSYKEIALLTGETLENVKTRIFRARSAMRRMLRPYLEGAD